MSSVHTRVPPCAPQARQLPEEVLTRVVRGRFVTQEYPASLERLYVLTPEVRAPGGPAGASGLQWAGYSFPPSC